jgi:hypothetical protein
MHDRDSYEPPRDAPAAFGSTDGGGAALGLEIDRVGPAGRQARSRSPTKGAME